MHKCGQLSDRMEVTTMLPAVADPITRGPESPTHSWMHTSPADAELGSEFYQERREVTELPLNTSPYAEGDGIGGYAHPF